MQAQERSMTEESDADLVELATELTIAWLSNPNNRAMAEDVPAFLRTMHATVSALSGDTTGAGDAGTSGESTPEHVTAVSVRNSLASKDHILSLIAGKPYKKIGRASLRERVWTDV